MAQFKKAIVESTINNYYFALLIIDTLNENKTYVNYFAGVDSLEGISEIEEFLNGDVQKYVDDNNLHLWGY